jgi:hypothetical protein
VPADGGLRRTGHLFQGDGIRGGLGVFRLGVAGATVGLLANDNEGMQFSAATRHPIPTIPTLCGLGDVALQEEPVQ